MGQRDKTWPNFPTLGGSIRVSYEKYKEKEKDRERGEERGKERVKKRSERK